MIVSMFTFSFTMSITPGPVNMIILSSGVNYGAKRTIPYVSGATIGFTLLLLSIGLGFYQFIQSYPNFLTYLAMIGALYIVYMGYKIAISKPAIPINSVKPVKPEMDINNIKKQAAPKFHEGFILQWINPKAWIACVSGASLFSQAGSYNCFVTFTAIYFLACYGSLALWAIFGQQLSHLLNNHFRLRLFNWTMGAMLMGTAVYLVTQSSSIWQIFTFS